MYAFGLVLTFLSDFVFVVGYAAAADCAAAAGYAAEVAVARYAAVAAECAAAPGCLPNYFLHCDGSGHPDPGFHGVGFFHYSGFLPVPRAVAFPYCFPHAFGWYYYFLRACRCALVLPFFLPADVVLHCHDWSGNSLHASEEAYIHASSQLPLADRALYHDVLPREAGICSFRGCYKNVPVHSWPQ